MRGLVKSESTENGDHDGIRSTRWTNQVLRNWHVTIRWTERGIDRFLMEIYLPPLWSSGALFGCVNLKVIASVKERTSNTGTHDMQQDDNQRWKTFPAPVRDIFEGLWQEVVSCCPLGAVSGSVSHPDDIELINATVPTVFS